MNKHLVIYYTVESLYRLKDVFLNLKNFYILDIHELIKSMHLDLSKGYNVYYVNKTILDTLEEQSDKNSVKGVIFINKGLTIEVVNNITEQLSKKHIDVKNILIDNGSCPKVKQLYPYFEDILFYERFRKIKISDFTENNIW